MRERRGLEGTEGVGPGEGARQSERESVGVRKSETILTPTLENEKLEIFKK